MSPAASKRHIGHARSDVHFKFKVGQDVRVRLAGIAAGPGSDKRSREKGFVSSWETFNGETMRVDRVWATGRINKQIAPDRSENKPTDLLCQKRYEVLVLVPPGVLDFRMMLFAETKLHRPEVDPKTAYFPVLLC